MSKNTKKIKDLVMQGIPSSVRPKVNTPPHLSHSPSNSQLGLAIVGGKRFKNHSRAIWGIFSLIPYSILSNPPYRFSDRERWRPSSSPTQLEKVALFTSLIRPYIPNCFFKKGAALGREGTVALVHLDLPRTFPALSIFQAGGPCHGQLAQVLEAYVCYRPDVG